MTLGHLPQKNKESLVPWNLLVFPLTTHGSTNDHDPPFNPAYENNTQEEERLEQNWNKNWNTHKPRLTWLQELHTVGRHGLQNCQIWVQMLATSDDRCDPALKACESAAKWSYHHLSWRTELTTNVCEALSTLPALRNCSINSHYCQLPLLQQKEKRRNSELKQLIHVVRRKTLLYTDILTM